MLKFLCLYNTNMNLFTCMMQKYPWSLSLYCWMLIIFGRIVWTLFMWNVYYLHLHIVHVQCICQEDCTVLLIERHRVQVKKSEYNFSEDAVILMTCITVVTQQHIKFVCVLFPWYIYMLHWKINVLKYSNSYDMKKWQ